MFIIRRIHDDILPANRLALEQAQRILRSHFSAAPPGEFEAVGERLRNPFGQGMRTLLLVAGRSAGKVSSVALMLYEPQLHFLYLDYLASERVLTSRGMGGALYEAMRDEARALGCLGIFFECRPDEPEQCPDPLEFKAARQRLRFYESFGARPIVGTDYQRPVKPDQTCMPFLVLDPLGRLQPLSREELRAIVRAILERKYRNFCPPEYVEAVVQSIRDDPVQLRDWRYHRRGREPDGRVFPRLHRPVGLVVNDRHDIHHVRDRGYVESPVRIPRIMAELDKTGAFETLPPRSFPLRHVLDVHDARFVDFLRRACALVGERTSIYPYVFPIRNRARPPRELGVRAGYYCIDTFTPLNANAWLAARRAVDCSLTAAEQILQAGRRLAYALVRPPGHHAERGVFGGFCYFNNCAVAAQHFSHHGRVAILDVDYHHGNGQQDIFFHRADVLTISIHGHPDIAYPYFSGFSDETGTGVGEGYNLNLPLPEHLDGERYRRALRNALGRIQDFRPDFLVLALGLDTAKGDPTGTWSLRAEDFRANGQMIGELDLPTLVVQEGGYRTRTLGTNAVAFFSGLLEVLRP